MFIANFMFIEIRICIVCIHLQDPSPQIKCITIQ